MFAATSNANAPNAPAAPKPFLDLGNDSSPNTLPSFNFQGAFAATQGSNLTSPRTVTPEQDQSVTVQAPTRAATPATRQPSVFGSFVVPSQHATSPFASPPPSGAIPTVGSVQAPAAIARNDAAPQFPSAPANVPIQVMTPNGPMWLVPVANGQNAPMPTAAPVMQAMPGFAPQPAAAPADNGPKQLIVNFLDPAVTNADLHAAFSPLGPLTAARVIYDKATGNSRCFGFVYFKRSADAARAVEEMTGRMIMSRRIKASYASPQRPLQDE